MNMESSPGILLVRLVTQASVDCAVLQGRWDVSLSGRCRSSLCTEMSCTNSPPITQPSPPPPIHADGSLAWRSSLTPRWQATRQTMHARVETGHFSFTKFFFVRPGLGKKLPRCHFPRKTVDMFAFFAASATVNVRGGKGKFSAQSQAGCCPQPSAPVMHSRFGVRPDKTDDRVGEHTADPA